MKNTSPKVKNKINSKWYSDGLSHKEAEKINKAYAKIERPVYGISDRSQLALQFHLALENGRSTDWQLTDLDDIKQLLSRTKSYEVPRLEDKVVEVFTHENMLRGISVNENLI